MVPVVVNLHPQFTTMKKKNRSKIEDEMRNHIQAWQTSKQSQQLYCHENNLAYHTFIYWHNKFRRKQNPIEQAFIPVQMSQPPNPTQVELEISYPNGVRLRVPADIHLIGQLIRLI
jgi:hypothetical protein